MAADGPRAITYLPDAMVDLNTNVSICGSTAGSVRHRSAFAARFTELAGETPMHYVARWRMQVAMSLLKDRGVTISELAIQLGYQSEAAFSRAFKRFTGVSPGSVRQHGSPPRGACEELPRLSASPG